MTDQQGADGGATVVKTKAPSSRSRRVLAGIALVLACLVIMLTTVAVWVHQVALNTDRFTALTASVVAQPEIIDPLSARISAQVITALDVQTRVASRLPDAAKPLAGAITTAVQEAIDKRLQVALANPKIQAALVKTLSFTHAQLMALLRDQSSALSIVDGYVVVQVFPVVGAALDQLQQIGLIPADVQLPDLSTGEPPQILGGRLQTALGITLPADFGTIQLMPADKVVAARTYVRAFDFIVVALIVLSIVLVLLTLWLASNRRHMLIYVAIGTIIAFLLARLTTHAIEESIVSGIADVGVAGAIQSVVDATIQDLRRVTSVVLVATGLVAIAAYLWGRPKWVTTVASSAGDAAGRAGASAAAAGSARVGAAAAKRPSRASMDETVRNNRSLFERYGLAVIGFILLWIAVGLEIALLAAALVIGFEVLLRAIASPAEPDAAAATAGDQPASGT